MSDVAKRPNRTPRRVREQRAFRLVVVGGISGTIAIVGFVLALFGIGSMGFAFLAAVIAVVCVLMFRRMTTPR